MKHIVKRRGHKEPFDEKKIYASCYAACLSAHLNHVEAEKICAKVAGEIQKWVAAKDEVTSHEIFLQTAKTIKKHHREAAFMYATHRDIS